MESAALKGLDSLLSTVQMPAGIPVGTLGIGGAGARNAALLAVAMLANSRPELREKLRQFRAEQSAKVLRETLPHLVALDYEIPRCCCETTVRIIREDPILAMTPLLLLHQGREPEAMERMARWERVRFLQRPLQVEALLQAVRAIHPAISISS